jgi:hypothetical protein
MSLSDKMRCKGCNHPRYTHNGSHKKGRRTMCQQQVGESHLDKCTCQEFQEPEMANTGLLQGKQA